MAHNKMRRFSLLGGKKKNYAFNNVLKPLNFKLENSHQKDYIVHNEISAFFPL